MDSDINNLLKTDEDNPHESNKDNFSSNTPGSFNTISSLARRFKSVFVVLYYINIYIFYKYDEENIFTTKHHTHLLFKNSIIKSLPFMPWNTI